MSHFLLELGEKACSSLMDRWTRGVQTDGEVTRTPPLGRVVSSEDVLTNTFMVSKGGMTPRFTTNTILSRSSSSTT